MYDVQGKFKEIIITNVDFLHVIFLNVLFYKQKKYVPQNIFDAIVF